MSYTIIKKLTPIESILQELPVSDEAMAKISRDRLEVKNILSGKDQRLLVIVGPCSAWPSEALIEYANRLNTLSNQVSDQLKIIMRVYVQKPRSRLGWAGPLNQPDPLKPADLETGIRYARSMMLKVIGLGLPIASEAVFTHNAKCFIELLSWVAVGARSVQDQEHRIYASSLDCAVGMKNPTHGNMKLALNSIISAQHPHLAAFDGYEIQTHGNPYAHLVLRGFNQEPNYTLPHLQEALSLMQRGQIKNPSLIIDASHDNSYQAGSKDYSHQAKVLDEVLNLRRDNPELKPLIKGFMLESFIKAGSQKIDQTLDRGGLSITDPCLGWEDTQDCLLNLAKRLEHD